MSLDSLLHAVAANDLELVRELLAAGVDPSERIAGHGPSAMNNVVSGDMVRLLLAHGADPMRECCHERTPIHNAARLGRTEVVGTLIDAGVPTDLLSRRGTTPLLDAVTGAKLEVVRMLLERGADPNASNEEGTTALMLAVGNDYRKPEIVRLLLDHGADCNARNFYGANVLHVAADSDDNEPEHDPGRNRREIYAMLRDAGVELEVLNDSGHTPFLYAVVWGLPDEAIDMLRIGASPLARVDESDSELMPDGGTVLHFTEYTEFTLPLFEAAIKAGADLEAIDASYQRPIDRFLDHCGNLDDSLRDAFIALLTPPGG